MIRNLFRTAPSSPSSSQDAKLREKLLVNKTKVQFRMAGEQMMGDHALPAFLNMESKLITKGYFDDIKRVPQISEITLQRRPQLVDKDGNALAQIDILERQRLIDADLQSNRFRVDVFSHNAEALKMDLITLERKHKKQPDQAHDYNYEQMRRIITQQFYGSKLEGSTLQGVQRVALSPEKFVPFHKIFKKISLPTLNLLFAKACTLVRLQENQVLQTEGSSASSFYIIIVGRLDISQIRIGGSYATLYHGDSVCEEAILPQMGGDTVNFRR